MLHLQVKSLLAAPILLVLVATGCGQKKEPQEPPATAGPEAAAPAALAGFIADAVSDPGRLADARVRDPYRKPADMLSFSGIRPGDTVVEIAPGGGYYTALLSRVVGPSGKVYAVDSERLHEYMPSLREMYTKYIEADPRENVEYSSQRLDALQLPADVDQVWMVQFYHDTIWLDVDRAAMNKAFFDALKPGGVYLVIDHSALAGAGDAVTKDLHRVDSATVKAEIEAAGFVRAGTSDVLANADDPLDDSVFDEARRGRTDRFVWKFVKPQ
jgi:predicted methyltransferase